MSKYTPELLKAMARTALRAKHFGDRRYSDLAMSLCVKTGHTPVQVEQRIKALAHGV